MKRAFKEWTDPRRYYEHRETPAITPKPSLSQITPRLCARCKVNPLPVSTIDKPIPPGRKYCDACRPLARREALAKRPSKGKRKL